MCEGRIAAPRRGWVLVMLACVLRRWMSWGSEGALCTF